MISSSQAITATARNSRPLARCMVLIETWPLVVSTCSSRTLNGKPAAFDGGLRAIQLRVGADEHAELVRQHAGLCLLRDPAADCFDLLAFALERRESSAAGR